MTRAEYHRVIGQQVAEELDRQLESRRGQFLSITAWATIFAKAGEAGHTPYALYDMVVEEDSASERAQEDTTPLVTGPDR